MPRPGYSGKSPDARTCPRCGKSVGGRYGTDRFELARHHTPDGKPCREKREPVTGRVVT